jgi:hypothetical protein
VEARNEDEHDDAQNVDECHQRLIQIFGHREAERGCRPAGDQHTNGQITGHRNQWRDSRTFNAPLGSVSASSQARTHSVQRARHGQREKATSSDRSTKKIPKICRAQTSQRIDGRSVALDSQGPDD